MSKLFAIDNNFIFTPARVDGAFWSQFHELISYLGNPDELVRLKNEEPEQYYMIIQPLITFVETTEKELHSRGYLKEIEIPEDNS